MPDLVRATDEKRALWNFNLSNVLTVLKQVRERAVNLREFMKHVREVRQLLSPGKIRKLIDPRNR